jgi:D-alanine--D-alanine ligase
MFKIAVICGGPSAERGISLNSARSILDHLSSDTTEIIPFYVDCDLNFHLISSSQLYSNTPSDFDFKLHGSAKALDQQGLIEALKGVDLVFPAIHGEFGEDGQIQTLLEEIKVPFIGSDSRSCQKMYCKYEVKNLLKAHGLPTLTSECISQENLNTTLISDFFEKNKITKAIVKPTKGGSSIGVSTVKSPEEALKKCELLLNQKKDQICLLESFCKGVEFTVVVFQSDSGAPLALIPTEIEINDNNNEIFDYRKKYLPTNQAYFHTPPRFNKEVISAIRDQAEQLFTLFDAKDFVRMDGWVMPDNTLYFTDINPISGMEQNSFLFRQAAFLGLTHEETLSHLVRTACKRQEIDFPQKNRIKKKEELPIYVLFGGKNAEKQISLMSGTNVWLKFLLSSKYHPTLFFYDPYGKIWKIPYAYALNHTVEEVYMNCLSHSECSFDSTVKSIQTALKIDLNESNSIHEFSLNEFLLEASDKKAFVFIALHGGEGEDGTLQKQLESYQIPFNGSNSAVSQLCMNKYLTGKAIQKLNHPDVLSLPKLILDINYLTDAKEFWKRATSEFQTDQIIIKPMCDGCSAGIVLLGSLNDLSNYLYYVYNGVKCIPAYSFKNQKSIIEMPSSMDLQFILEPYIETDEIIIHQKELKHVCKTGWIELTVGILEIEGSYSVLNPSVTIAEGAVLSLEEKFQGGTGVNLTPPPESIISKKVLSKIKELIKIASAELHLKNYARIDIFYNSLLEKVIIIEVNTLPALTPSTVLYHQGLAEELPLSPLMLLEKIVFSAVQKRGQWALV